MAVRAALEISHRRLRRGPPVSAGELILTPVAIEQFEAGVIAQNCWIVAAKRPVAIIVAGPDGRRLIRLDTADPN